MEDPFSDFKKKQREGWAHFAPIEQATCVPAAHLVRFVAVRPAERVLDVGCGTGVVAVAAALEGAEATGLDLTPELLDRAHENTKIAGVDIAWHEGDAERLPFADASFDVVLSQFGHIFAPRPDVVTAEMLRVLRPGGRIAFATWPPEHFTGEMFTLMSRYAPPPPPGALPPVLWGDINVMRDRLGAAVHAVTFERGVMHFPALSVPHMRATFEGSVGPLIKLIPTLAPEALQCLRADLDALIRRYYSGNQLRQDYLLTRAIKN